MKPDRKNIDKAIRCGLPLSHLLNTGRTSGNRTRQNCGIFVSGTLKGVPGWVGNITNTYRCSCSQCSTARHFAESIEQENKSMHEDLLALLEQVRHSITILEQLYLNQPPDKQLNAAVSHSVQHTLVHLEYDIYTARMMAGGGK